MASDQSPLLGDSDVQPYTLDAEDDVTGKWMHFEDYVEAGDEVDLYRNPERETGYRGSRIVYLTDDGEWRLRELNPGERDARHAKIMARHHA